MQKAQQNNAVETESNYNSASKAIDHFGCKDGLRNQKKTNAEVKVITQTDNENGLSQNWGWLYYIILNNDAYKNKSSAGDLFRFQVRKFTMTEKRTKLV